ncbi:MAG: hypothetical protein Kapaf2KO_05750 [Candidatus Kapaibacteriales bacterium]
MIMKIIYMMFLFILSIHSLNSTEENKGYISKIDKPKISFSFDDGSTNDYKGYSNLVWNQMILDALKKHDINATIYVKGVAMDNEKGDEILKQWGKAGHIIGNHTYNHPYFNSSKVFALDMKNELLKTDDLIKNYEGFKKLFRFPYLKKGENIAERDSFRTILKEAGYKNGYVTIDASDWFIDGRLINSLKAGEEQIERYKQYFIEHIYERAMYYEKLSNELTNRHINHTLLLHHNISAGLFLDDLIEYFKEKDWDVISQSVALADPIYDLTLDVMPSGESIVWSLAKSTGQYDELLRYPAESGEYEQPKMDSLGL